MNKDYNRAPVERTVSGGIYALADPSGKIRSAGTTLDSVTRTLIGKEMPTPMWNALFGNSDPAARAKIYEKHGWRVMHGTFTPNAELRRAADEL